MKIINILYKFIYVLSSKIETKIKISKKKIKCLKFRFNIQIDIGI